MIIDAHQHVWDLDRVAYPWLGRQHGPIHRTVAQEEVLPRLRAHGVDAVVLVQAADDDADTALMLDTAAAHPAVVAVVGYVPLEDPDATAARLPALAADPLVVGIRNLIHDRPDADFLLRPEVGESLGLVAAAGLAFDVVGVLPRHLEHVPVLAAEHPGLRLVVDHLGAPPLDGPPADLDRWRTLLTRAAEAPQVHAKVSGLYPDGGLDARSAELLRPVVAHAVEVFGPERLMYGGDWPVSLLAGGYDAVWDSVQPLLAGLGADAAAAVLGGTAARVYRVDPARLAAAAASGERA
ncbi:amidohydrolase family protein [Microlunatus capsulatus]|uniref:L-fuconolactonase n=1 Tax=Microlunatus capsulatus TaxID=99117 RepID=A0ABS4Z7A1_9ACTN|nr:amidohydrolase family protein [Microlunatus capsulatus]MBP2416600.1 L-fuconolactonase [Microlunatus capsulatus]